MTVTAPPRPPRPSDPVTHGEFDALVEALIEEARQRGLRRRRRRGAIAILVALVGAALFAVFGRSAESQDASSGLTARPAALLGATNAKLAFTQGSEQGDCGPCPTPALYVKADGSGKRKLASHVGGDPFWSPGGRTIAFIGRRTGNAEVYVVNAEGSGLRRLTRTPGSDSGFTWSPDGRKIAFLRLRPQGASSSHWDVYVMNPDGSGERRLSRNAAYTRNLAWSPDGRKVAFLSRRWRDDNSRLYVVNADGSGLRSLTLAPDRESVFTWFPDGRIAFSRDRNSELYVMNADGSGLRRLKHFPESNSAFSWSPDGRKVAFERDGSIYVMNADGRGQQRLALGGGPLWSPDGKKIAYSRTLRNGVGSFPYARSNSDIFVMNVDGTQQHNVTRSRRWDDCCVAWSPGQ